MLIPMNSYKKALSFAFLNCAVALFGLVFVTGCHTTGSIEKGEQATIRVGPVTDAPGIAVFGGDLGIKEATAAALLEVLRGEGFVVVPKDAAARYEVRSVWRVSSSVDEQSVTQITAPDSPYADAYVRRAVLMVRIVDLQDGDKVVYESASWPTNVDLLGPGAVKSAVDVALSGL